MKRMKLSELTGNEILAQSLMTWDYQIILPEGAVLKKEYIDKIEELDILSDMMKRVAEKNISPDEKLLEMIYTRLDAVKEVVYRNGTLRAYFFRDIWRVEKVRKKFDAKEVQLFKAVLLEGQAKGVFHIDDVEMTADLIHYCVKGIEVPYIRGHIGAHLDEDTRNRYVSNIVFGALHRTEI